MDNRHLSPKELDIFRRKIVDAVVNKNYRQSMVAELYGFTKASVNRYVQAYRKYGEKSFEYKPRGTPKGYGNRRAMITRKRFKKQLNIRHQIN